MMKQFTVRALWGLVNRAETLDQIETAKRVLDGQGEQLDMDTYGDMMNALAYKTREYYHSHK